MSHNHPDGQVCLCSLELFFVSLTIFFGRRISMCSPSLKLANPGEYSRPTMNSLLTTPQATRFQLARSRRMNMETHGTRSSLRGCDSSVVSWSLRLCDFFFPPPFFSAIIVSVTYYYPPFCYDSIELVKSTPLAGESSITFDLSGQAARGPTESGFMKEGASV